MTDRPLVFMYDRMVGDYRLPSYDYSEEKMRECGQRLIRHRPDYVLSYSMALDTLARVNAHRADAFRSLGMKAVIGGSEGFPSQDSMGMVGEVFGCPVAMEYASYEAGLMAHTNPDGMYSVFWRNHFLEAGEESRDGARIARVTSLYERCFPLVRYEIGDEIALLEERELYGLRGFKAVVGRTNSHISLADGAKIHCRAIGHCVRDVEGVAAFQVVQGGGSLDLSIIFEGDLPAPVEELIRSRLGRVHPLLADMRIRAVETLLQTASGKTPVIIDEPQPGA
jgi:phenylacetate-coenzyme A ligase PaaK-like adenylate-forming protein